MLPNVSCNVDNQTNHILKVLYFFPWQQFFFLMLILWSMQSIFHSGTPFHAKNQIAHAKPVFVTMYPDMQMKKSQVTVTHDKYLSITKS